MTTPLRISMLVSEQIRDRHRFHHAHNDDFGEIELYAIAYGLISWYPLSHPIPDRHDPNEKHKFRGFANYEIALEHTDHPIRYHMYDSYYYLPHSPDGIYKVKGVKIDVALARCVAAHNLKNNQKFYYLRCINGDNADIRPHNLKWETDKIVEDGPVPDPSTLLPRQEYERMPGETEIVRMEPPADFSHVSAVANRHRGFKCGLDHAERLSFELGRTPFVPLVVASETTHRVTSVPHLQITTAPVNNFIRFVHEDHFVYPNCNSRFLYYRRQEGRKTRARFDVVASPCYAKRGPKPHPESKVIFKDGNPRNIRADNLRWQSRDEVSTNSAVAKAARDARKRELALNRWRTKRRESKDKWLNHKLVVDPAPHF